MPRDSSVDQPIRHSTAHAVATFDDPYISFLEYLADPSHSPILQHTVRPEEFDSASSAYMVKLCKDLSLDPSLTAIVQDFVTFNTEVNRWFARDARCLDFLDLIMWSSMLSHRLLIQLNKCRPITAQPLDAAVTLALLVFAVRCSESYARGVDPLVFSTVKWLTDSLSALDPEAWSAAPDLHIWVCILGTCAARTMAEEQDWFVSQLVRACKFHGIRTKEELLTRMRRCLWVEQKLDGWVDMLWLSLRLSIV